MRIKPILFRLSLNKKLPSGWESVTDSDIFLAEVIKQGYSYTVKKDAVYLPLYY